MAYEMVGLGYSLRVYRIREFVGKTGAGVSWGNESVTFFKLFLHSPEPQLDTRHVLNQLGM